MFPVEEAAAEVVEALEAELEDEDEALEELELLEALAELEVEEALAEVEVEEALADEEEEEAEPDPPSRQTIPKRQARFSTAATSLLTATGRALAVAKKARIGKRAYIVIEIEGG
jgi:hypothetical protein